jgi:hypothetical protein
LKHYASPKFWALYQALPSSLHLKKLGDQWWFWIGTHADYDRLVG